MSRANQCTYGTWRSGNYTDRCGESVVPGRMFCEGHLAEALSRVTAIAVDRPRPWGGVVRGSQVGQRWGRVAG